MTGRFSQTQSESIRGHNQTGSDVWERMLGDEGNQHEEEDASLDPRSVETRSHAKRRNTTHITPFIDRRGYAQWQSALVWIRPKKQWRSQGATGDMPPPPNVW